MVKPRIRCAIYTRKSSDEGLDQDFNSLDAQHEACAAYVASQRHEGWSVGRNRYDDGGISGGTIERPALQSLLADIEAGQVQMVVVYKIDRLTRSLADFAKLVERFDAAGCSFVSVTQAFNTASSMGRLTLNVLLSFAQFEREVTAERIRDKIAASKKKGLWMGGVPPLGYDPDPDPKTRSLVINPPEAKTVCAIFGLYDDLGCLNAVMRRADEMRLRSKLHRFKSGRVQGGNRLSRGQIHALLRNPIYIGKIRHKAKIWDGLHEPIVDAALWNRVQAKMQTASTRPRVRTNTMMPYRAPFIGKLRDETGDRLTPSHARRDGRRIRYYVSNRLISGGTDPLAWRLPAIGLERAVAKLIADHLIKLGRSHRLLLTPDLPRASLLRAPLRNLADRLVQGDPMLLAKILAKGTLEAKRITLTLCPNVLSQAIAIEPDEIDPRAMTFEANFSLRRRGIEGKIVIGDPVPQPDGALLRALSKAHAWASDLRGGKPISEIASAAGYSEAYIRTRAQLAFLSPMIQNAILQGTHPPEFYLKKLLRTPIPLDWDQQARRYGFASKDAYP